MLVCLLFLFYGLNQVYAQLQVNFTIDKSGGCSPLTVNFTNTTRGASSNATYQWDFGNSNTSVLQNPGAVFVDERTYTITLTVKDGNKTSSASKTVTVYKKPTADFTVGAPKVCMPYPGVFDASLSSAGDGFINNYNWDFGDGITQPTNSPQISHNYSKPQKPTVSLTVTNNYGCTHSITKVTPVEVLDYMRPAFSYSKNVLCEITDPIQLTNTSTGPGTLSYSWDFGDGNGAASTQTNPSYVYNKKGVFNITLTMKNTDGCSATLTNGPVNVRYFNTDFNTSLLCREATFNGTYNGPNIYVSNSEWNFGDNVITNSSLNIKHTYATAGTYTVKLTNTYNGVCKEDVSKEIDVKDLVNYNSNFSVSPGVLCRGGNVSFTPTSSVQPSFGTWSYGDGYSNTYYGNQNHVYSSAGTYTVTLTNTFGTCQETVKKDIVVNELPNPNGFITQLSAPCGAPSVATFKDTTAGAVGWNWYYYNYYWNTTNFSNGSPTASYNFTSDGSYLIRVNVTNAAGCSASTEKTINIGRPTVQANITKDIWPGGIDNCDTRVVTFGATGSEPIKDYQWNFGDGSAISTEATPTHAYTNFGNYTATLSYTTISGCKGTTFVYNITVYTRSKANFTWSLPACTDRPLALFNVTGGPYTSLLWDFGSAGGSSGNASTSFNYPDTGRYNVKLIMYDGGCIPDTIIKPIYDSILPAFIRITSVSPQLCDGTRGTITFDQTSLRAKGGIWNFGDGTSITYDTSQHIVKHTYTQTGTYGITLTGTYGSCPLISSSSTTILLKQRPTLTLNKTALCSNHSLTASIAGLETNPYVTSSWYLDRQYYQYYVVKFEYEDGTPLPEGNVYYNWNYTTYSSTLSNLRPGNRKIRAIIGHAGTNCFDTTAFVPVIVNGPIAGYKITTNNVCYKSPLVFQDTSKIVTSTPIVSWQWNFADGTPVVNATSNAPVSHTFAFPGQYNVSLTVTDAGGCSSSASAVYPNYANARGSKAAFTASSPFGGDIVPLNTTVNLYNNSIENAPGGINYTWKINNQNISSNYSTSYIFTTPGDYIITLTATDPVTSCIDVATHVIKVRDFNTAFKFSSSNINSNGCAPVRMNITNLSTNYTKLIWDFGDGSIIEDATHPSHIYNKPGKYIITLYTNGYNDLTGRYRDSIIIDEPSAQMDIDILNRCVFQPIKLSAEATNTVSYLWDFGDGTLTGTTNNESVHAFTTAGTYTATLLVKAANGCTVPVTATDKIKIDSPFIAINSSKAITMINDPISNNPLKQTVLCLGGTLQLTATGSDSYTWSPASGLSSTTIPDPVVTAPATTKYIVKGLSNAGCQSSDSINVLVARPFTITVPEEAEVCKLSSVQLSAQGADTYSWINYTSGLNNTQIANPFASPLSDATYTVVGYDKYNCFTDTADIKVIVRPLPSVNAGQDVQVVANTEVQLSATGSSDVLKWSWTPTDYLSCTGCPSPVAKPKRTMDYVVSVKNQYNCLTSDTVHVKLICTDGYIYIPNAFTPAGNGKNDVFYIKGKGIGIIKSLRIYDRGGYKVFERLNFEIDNPSAGWDGRINGQPAATGTYVYVAEMQCESGEAFVHKGTVILFR